MTVRMVLQFFWASSSVSGIWSGPFCRLNRAHWIWHCLWQTLGKLAWNLVFIAKMCEKNQCLKKTHQESRGWKSARLPVSLVLCRIDIFMPECQVLWANSDCKRGRFGLEGKKSAFWRKCKIRSSLVSAAKSRGANQFKVGCNVPHYQESFLPRDSPLDSSIFFCRPCIS